MDSSLPACSRQALRMTFDVCDSGALLLTIATMLHLQMDSSRSLSRQGLRMTNVECDSNVIVFIYRNVSSSTNGFLALLGMTKGVCESNVTVFINRNVSSFAYGFLAEPIQSGARNDKMGMGFEFRCAEHSNHSFRVMMILQFTTQ